MKWYSTLKSSTSFERGVREASAEVNSRLGATPADLGILFFSPAFRAEAVDLWSVIRKELPFHHIIGCTGGGVIGGGQEEEDEPAISLTGAVLPGVRISPFSLQQESLPTPDAGPRDWRRFVGVEPTEEPGFLVLTDPFSLESDALLEGLDYAYPAAVKVGGLASGATRPGDNLLLSDDKILSKGATGVALSGNIQMDAVVAQGCRPIGDPLTVTEADGNMLLSVNDRPPLAYLQDLYENLAPRDQELMQTSLFVGLLMNPFLKSPKQGDFLIRNIIGLDQSTGVLAIGGALRAGQTVQFHLRDAKTSHDDLALMLEKAKLSHPEEDPGPVGAMLFSCLGRGRRLYGEPHHDSKLVQSTVGDVALGGFFCNGEIGPVGGKTYLHGYTSSIAVFSPRRSSATSEPRKE